MLVTMAVTPVPLPTVDTVNNAAHSLVSALVDYAARGTALLLIASIITGLLRRKSAASRHAVWAVSITMLAALPLLSRVAPPMVVSLPVAAPIAPRTAIPIRVAAPSTTAHEVVLPRRADRSVGLGSDSRPGVSSVAITAVRHRVPPVDIAPFVASIWVVGALTLLLRFIAGTIVVWRRALDAEPVKEAGWVMLAREIAHELGIRRPVTLLITRAPAVPVTWGIVYPVVLVPENGLTWPGARRRAVLLHELAHVARFDAATQFIGQLVLAANWFNPLAWLAMARLRAERERACDDVVLTRGMRASAYASDLLNLVRALRPSTAPGFAALAMARHGELERRVRFILDRRRPRAPSSIRATLLALGTVAPCALLVAAVRPSHPVSRERLAEPSSVPLVAHMAALVRSVTRLEAPSPQLVTGVHAPGVPTLQVASLDAENRCPVEADFIHGGVSGESGRPGSLEAEHGDHRILVVADDGRCETAHIDGTVALSNDASDVSGLGTGAKVTVTEAANGHTQLAEVIVAGEGPGVGYYVLGKPLQSLLGESPQPLYVIDGAIVGDTIGDETRKLWVIQQNNIDETLKASGVPGRSGGVNPDDSGRVYLRNGQRWSAAGAHRLIEFRYFVDGQPRPWEEGRDWFHTTLAAIIRETAYDVHDRVAQLRAHGGVPAVLDEIRRVRSEMGERAYFEALLDLGEGRPVLASTPNAAAYSRVTPEEGKQAADLAQSILPASTDRDEIVAKLRALSSLTSDLGTHPNKSVSVHVF